MTPSLSFDARASQGSDRLSRGALTPIVRRMNFKDGASLVADLTTIGRKSGQRRTVELRFLYYRGSFYATSTRVQGKHWCQNMLKNSAVTISAKREQLSCTARQVTDEALRKQVLTLRDSPPQLERAVFEITPKGG